MKLLTILVLCAASLCAQGNPVNQTQAPPPDAWTQLLFYDGSNNLIYSCKAKSIQPSFSWTRTATTLTDITVAANVGTVTTSTAHGLAVGNLVTVTGATIDTDLNGTYYIQTVGSTTTFTITTANVGNATYNESTLTVSTTAPRSSAPQWDIFKFIITGSTVSNVQKAFGKSGANSICDNRAVTTGATKITYQ